MTTSSNPLSTSHAAASLLALILRAKQGDAAATELLLSRYRPYLRVTCAPRLPQLCQQREDASDIVQHTLIDAMRGLKDFRGDTEAEFEFWMSRLLERNILQSVRRNTADKRDVRREVAEMDSRASATLSWHIAVADQSSVSSAIFRGEAALRLAEALERLPEDQRVAIELRYLGQQPLKSIANHMNKTTSSVAGLIRRGVKSLRKSVPALIEGGL